MTWVAEDVPWYLIDSTVDLPRTDEDLSVSAVRCLGSYDTEHGARSALTVHLARISTYRHVIQDNRSVMYELAAEALLKGVDGIRISGRYYRVRQV